MLEVLEDKRAVERMQYRLYVVNVAVDLDDNE
jgi:hypothetical protein